MDKEMILTAYIDNTKRIFEEFHKLICNKYNLSDDDGYEIVYLIMQLKQDFTLAIIDDTQNPFIESSICTISIISKPKYDSLDDINFIVYIEECKGISPPQKSTITIDINGLIQILHEYKNTKTITLYKDIYVNNK